MLVSMNPGATALTVMLRRGDFAGHGHGQADESGFGGGVVGLAGLSGLAEDAGDVDDASPALFEHGADDLLDAEIGGGQVGLRTASQSARFMRMTSWSRVMPALLTRMSILPNWRGLV
jgi:hypothetical protein